MMFGSAHTVVKCPYPAEMQVTFFKSKYLTQEEALKHHDGVVMVCYIIKHCANPHPRLEWVIEGFPRIKEAGTCTKIDPKPMYQLKPLFFEDYFLYWGNLGVASGDNYAIRWLVSRAPLCATSEQINKFRTLWNAWHEPNTGNLRPIQEKAGRHVFLISAHWNLDKSLIPVPREPEASISLLSEEYQRKPWMLPPQNASLLELLNARNLANEDNERDENHRKSTV